MADIIDRFNKINIINRWLIYIVVLCSFCVLILHFFKADINYAANGHQEIEPSKVAIDKNGGQSLGNSAQVPQHGYPSFLNDYVYKEGPVLGDSWMPMARALDFIQKHPNQPVYETLFKQGVKFQYPLSSLLVFDLPNRLTGASFSLIAYWLKLLSFFSVFLFAFICAKILFQLLKQPELKILNQLPSSTILQYCLILVLTRLFCPIIYSYKLGQIQTILTLFVAIIILCWQYNKKILAGILLGVICTIKPQLMLLFFWAVIRRQWNMVISGGITVTILLIISFQLYGFKENLHYLQILSFLSHHGESYYDNQSVNGLLNRLLFNGQNLIWDGSFPPYSPVIYIITLVSSLIFMAIGLFWNYKTKQPGIVDLCIMILCTTIASPIAWNHHYSILFPIFIVLSPYMLYFYADKKWVLIILSFAYVLVAINIDFLKMFANSTLNILQSYLFFGACIILLFLFIISRKIQKRAVQV